MINFVINSSELVYNGNFYPPKKEPSYPVYFHVRKTIACRTPEVLRLWKLYENSYNQWPCKIWADVCLKLLINPSNWPTSLCIHLFHSYLGPAERKHQEADFSRGGVRAGGEVGGWVKEGPGARRVVRVLVSGQNCIIPPARQWTIPSTQRPPLSPQLTGWFISGGISS